MSINANKAVITHFMAEVWNRNNLAVLDDLLDPTYYDYSYEPRNREGLERVLAIMNAAFPGHETIVEEIIGEGDTVAICQTLRATHSGVVVDSGPFRDIPVSGRSFEIGGYRFFKVINGKITSHRGLIDLPSLFRQIGMNA
jgi:predicted ester cyclase